MKTTIGQMTFTLQATERDGQWLARAARRQWRSVRH
jgi:hypothetical protein